MKEVRSFQWRCTSLSPGSRSDSACASCLPNLLQLCLSRAEGWVRLPAHQSFAIDPTNHVRASLLLPERADTASAVSVTHC